jgi:hypothetical protein
MSNIPKNAGSLLMRLLQPMSSQPLAKHRTALHREETVCSSILTTSQTLSAL